MAKKTFQNLEQQLSQFKSEARFRQCTPVSDRLFNKVNFNGHSMINLSSNDYLNIASNSSLHETFTQSLTNRNRIDEFGFGASSSRLLTGHHTQVEQLEKELAEAYGSKRALVFNSGYHANIGILSALLDKQDVIFSDRLNHASILDGARLSGARLIRYRHLDYDHLEQLLHKYRPQFRHAIIISESVFSMDGDSANLPRLIECKNRYESWLYVDEAHAVGVFGETGLGLAEVEQAIPQIEFIVGTFGKAFASIGAYIICDQIVKDFLINRMRPFIYTTALPPINIHWTRFVLSLMPQFNAQRQHLKSLSQQCREALHKKGLTTLGNSHIIPIILSENDKAVRSATKCQEHQLLVFPIRPPTVPAGTARLRLSLTSDLSWNDIKALPALIAETP